MRCPTAELLNIPQQSMLGVGLGDLTDMGSMWGGADMGASLIPNNRGSMRGGMVQQLISAGQQAVGSTIAVSDAVARYHWSRHLNREVAWCQLP